MEFHQPAFWFAVLQIIWINILLSGDNAVVIALACRRLPPRERRWGMITGAGVASVLLIVFTIIVVQLMALPYLKLVGGCVLLWIALGLLAPAGRSKGHIEAVEDLRRAIRIVVIADIVMSLDNVIAVAAAAKGNYLLLGLGLMVSIPIVIAGSGLIMRLLERFSILVWVGAALLGSIAGGLIAADLAATPYLARIAALTLEADSTIFGPLVHFKLNTVLDVIKTACALAGAIGVVAVGYWRLRLRRVV